MFRKMFLTAALLISVAWLFSQSNTEDVIYLKNGGIIRGMVIDHETGSKIKVEVAGGSVFVFQASEIDSLAKENVLKKRLYEIKHNYFHRDHGYRNMTELSIIYGVNFKNNPNNNNYYYYTAPSNQDDIGISFQTINGYQFFPYLFVGGGLGIDRFITYQQTFSPLFLRLSSDFLKRKVTPYVYFDAGYSFMWKQPSDGDIIYTQSIGGTYLAAGGGVRIYTHGRASVTLSAGYKMNKSNSTWNYADDTTDTYNIIRTYQRFVMNVGVSF